MWRRAVRLGEHDTASTHDGPTVDRDVVHIEKHDRYNKPYMTNDIAILYLKTDVEFTPRIKPVCLPLDSPHSERDYIGKRSQNSQKKKQLSFDYKLIFLTRFESVCCWWGESIHIYLLRLIFILSKYLRRLFFLVKRTRLGQTKCIVCFKWLRSFKTIANYRSR